MLWLFLIKAKSEALQVFKDFKKLVDRKSGKLIKILRRDNGGEYTSNLFDSFWTSQGIIHEVTTPYTPQHNGLSERRNISIHNMLRNMLKRENLSPELYGEVESTTAYILNKCPTKSLKEKVLDETWPWRKPSVNHMKIFGSLCYKHIPEAKRRKLYEKNKPMVLVGYHNPWAYKLFNLETNQIFICRDVIIIENEAWS